MIYGSLVPFNFNGISLIEGLERFAEVDKDTIAITATNRADWFTNFLLMIPAYTCLLLVNSRQKFGLRSVIYALSAMFAIACVSVAIEFAQVFFDGRISSFKDVYSQVLGMCLAFVIFFMLRKRAHALLCKFSSTKPADKWEVYATLILLVFIFYNLMPFDLSMSFTEIANKWSEGKISTIPFLSVVQNPFQGLLSIAVDTLIWLGITWCFLKSGKYHFQKVATIVVSIAIVLEILQLTVLSRYTDITDVIVAIIAVVLAKKLFTRHAIHTQSADQSSSKMSYVIAAALIYYLMLLGFATFPMDIVGRKQFATSLGNYFSTPFEVYWKDQPYVAISNIIRKIAVMIPLGMLIAYWRQHLREPKIANVLAVFVVLAVFFQEFVQTLIASKVASISDTVLNFLGLFLGYMIYRYHKGKQVQPTEERKEEQKGAKGRLSAYFTLVLPIFFVLYIFLIVLYKLPFTPYNVKELLELYSLPVSVFIIALFICFALFSPVIVMLQYRHKFSSWSHFVLLFGPLFTFLVSMGMLLVFPKEAIFDIVGSPVWKHLPNFIELLYRLVGLLLPICMLYVAMLAHNLIQRNRIQKKMPTKTPLQSQSTRGELPNAYRAAAFWVSFLFIVLPFSFFVVVVQAGTDNLTELFEMGGYSFSMLGFVLFFIMLSHLGLRIYAWLSSKNLKNTILGLIYLIVAGPLAYEFVQLGFVDYLLKYNRLFSPLQFLLSPDRDSLLAPETVKTVFIMLFYVLVASLSLTSILHIRVSSKVLANCKRDMQIEANAKDILSPRYKTRDKHQSM